MYIKMLEEQILNVVVLELANHKISHAQHNSERLIVMDLIVIGFKRNVNWLMMASSQTSKHAMILVVK